MSRPATDWEKILANHSQIKDLNMEYIKNYCNSTQYKANQLLKMGKRHFVKCLLEWEKDEQ